MTLILNTKTNTYKCDHMEVEANENGELVVTLTGNFPEIEQMTLAEAVSIANDSVFIAVLRLAYQHAMPGTPVFCAFDRMKRNGSAAILRFEQSCTDLEAAA